jgi:hypothetical protein
MLSNRVLPDYEKQAQVPTPNEYHSKRYARCRFPLSSFDVRVGSYGSES